MVRVVIFVREGREEKKKERMDRKRVISICEEMTTEKENDERTVIRYGIGRHDLVDHCTDDKTGNLTIISLHHCCDLIVHISMNELD